MFRTRLLSGIVLVVLALFFVIAGGNILLCSTAVISLIGLFEFYRVIGIHKSVLGVLGYLFSVFYYLILFAGNVPMLLPLFMLFLLLLLTFYVLKYPFYRIHEVAAAFFGFFYVSVLLSYIFQTREMPHGRYIVWLIFLCSWGCDTCAYCVGMLFGKHKMSPVLSPKKSVEGAVGGVVGTMILTGIFLTVFRMPMHLHRWDIIALVLVSGVGALLSMIGDLAASAIKRNYEIKDYGRLIPGHGGILDRFDSMIVVAPLVYYFAEVIVGLP